MPRPDFNVEPLYIYWITLNVSDYDFVIRFLGWLDGNDIKVLDRSNLYEATMEEIAAFAIRDEPRTLSFGFWKSDVAKVRQWLSDYGAKDTSPDAPVVDSPLVEHWYHRAGLDVPSREDVLNTVQTLLEAYPPNEIREAMRTAIYSYRKKLDGQVSQESVELALERLPRICELRRREQKHPLKKTIGRLQDFIRKSFKDADTWFAFYYMDQATTLGMTVDEIRTEVLKSVTFKQWANAMKARIQELQRTVPLREFWNKAVGAEIAKETVCMLDKDHTTLIVFIRDDAPATEDTFKLLAPDILHKWNRVARENGREIVKSVQFKPVRPNSRVWAAMRRDAQEEWAS